MKLCTKDVLMNFFKSSKGIYDIYCQSKDTTDFCNSQGKLELQPSSMLLVEQFQASHTSYIVGHPSIQFVNKTFNSLY